ncbi:transposable element Tcb2 transposase [Trichonephila clavipes]|nr:transposable element Tcb2 transposase [Trichonephila clavipes]
MARLREIILGSRTNFHVQRVTMTGHIYRDVILEQHVSLFRGAKGAEFLFMDDNAHPHRANIIDECLQSEDITRIDWPAYSPDLNPIEHVWVMLGRRIAARLLPPTCLPELRRVLLYEWCKIPQDQIDNLILSMPRRCHSTPTQTGEVLSEAFKHIRVLPMSDEATMVRSVRTSIVTKGVSYTDYFRCCQKEKYKGLRPRERGGQERCWPRQIQLPGCVAERWLRTVV